MNADRIKQECSQWTDKEGNSRYYLNRWSKYVPSVKLTFAQNQITAVDYISSVDNDEHAMTVDEFKAIKVWFDDSYTLHVKCAVDQGLKAEIEERVGSAFGSDVASVTVTGQPSAVPAGNISIDAREAINGILDRMERNCLDVNEIMKGIREIRELTK